VKTLALAAFTLVWTHSIEKVDWQEDWHVTPDGLELVQARVKGSGAGMEPPLAGGCAATANAARCRIFSAVPRAPT
jgi:hypothetical protein